MRVMGIDFGERRIGVALSDDGGRVAVPWGVVERDTDRRAVYRLASLARDEGVEALVLGEPRHPETGERGEAAERVQRFGRKLEKAAKLPVRWVEETLTTVEAAERLAAAGLDRRDRPERRDAVAAQILLQQALDEGMA
ncbi:MAG: Holliday junction resolvase RuvX [Acidobacteriota bacterium]